MMNQIGSLLDSQVVNRLLAQLLYLLVILCTAVSELYTGVYVGWRVDVRVIKHGDHREKDGLHIEDWSPSLIC